MTVKVGNNYQQSFQKICPSGGNYKALDIISRGAYGTVYRATDIKTGEIVALKHEIRGICRSTLREITILKSLPPHPSIIGFKEAFQDYAGRVFVVMEYMEYDLSRFINAKKQPFTVAEVKMLMKQILEGVNFLHKHGLMHRDIKPSNILINNWSELKICDFGLSRNQMFPDLGLQRVLGEKVAGYTCGVGTRWYKAPELLVGERIYSVAVDMWSVGCIMAELVLKEVFFQGNSEKHQLECILQIVGAGDLVWTKFADATASSGAPWLGDSGFDLMERLLSLDPEKRINAEDALNHRWFKQDWD